MDGIRNTVKAVILRDGEVLMTRCRGQEGVFYLLPGGAQEPGESMAEAAVRECVEEIGCPVRVGRILHVMEYTRLHFDRFPDPFHQIEFLFACELPEGADPKGGPEPDDLQEAVEWVPLEQLLSLRTYPENLAEILLDAQDKTIYWGDLSR